MFFQLLMPRNTIIEKVEFAVPAKSAHSIHSGSSKAAVVHAALKLFNMSGYDGTSVRSIAAEAGVNVALVSYYFGGKQGLLEYLMSAFFEGYLREMETAVVNHDLKDDAASVRLVAIADRLIRYQQNYFYLSCFAHREMTLDNQLVRELMSTYLMKEKYLLGTLLETIVPNAKTDPLGLSFAVLQYHEMIVLPFTQPQFLRHVFFLRPESRDFRRAYLKQIAGWASRFDRRTATPPI